MQVLLRTGIVLCGLLSSLSVMAAERVIYGEDNRKDLFDPANDEMLLQMSKSTAILMKNADLSTTGAASGRFGIPKRTFKEYANVCDSERFGNQPNPGFCSGFLVGPDLFVTAGHCITSAAACADTSMVFGFGYDAEGKDLSSVPKSDVYRCKTIVKRELELGTPGRDYAVIKLDRPVTGREPLKVRRAGSVQVGDSVAVIGHPVGLPTKITDGAKVRKIDATAPYFVTNLDTYGGNSGSAVFNMISGDVEGILVRGETDFDMSPSGCRISRICAEGSCRGEDVTKAEIFQALIP